MKKLILIAFTVMMMSSSVYAGVDYDQQNWELDLFTAETSDC
ncbi:MAG: hypothetical protein OEX19_16125 [Gammaproteobacteria bacterium]|nr:hypothetical protein [Gammaproteobacteria bacterium]MDH5219232.1 hypothetical protein [Gammaproteobacteria bacterium]